VVPVVRGCVRYLTSLKPGDTVQVKGPFQKIEIPTNFKKAVGLVAGGTGISPMYQIIQKVLADRRDTTGAAGARVDAACAPCRAVVTCSLVAPWCRCVCSRAAIRDPPHLRQRACRRCVPASAVAAWGVVRLSSASVSCLADILLKDELDGISRALPPAAECCTVGV
jgi:hypothetical protein